MVAGAAAPSLRWPGWALVVAAGVLVVCLARLPSVEVETDLASLLPAGRTYTDDYLHFLERFGGLEQVYLVVGAERETAEGVLLDAALWLEDQLEQSVLFESARSGIDEADEDFVLEWVVPNAPFLLAEEELERRLRELQPEALARRAQSIRGQVASPLSPGVTQLLQIDPLGWSTDLLTPSRGEDSLPVDAMSGRFLSPDGGAALVIASPAEGELDAASGRAILREVARLEEALRAEWDADDAWGLRLRPLGGPLYAAWDEAALRNDLQVTLSISLLLSLLVLALGLRSVLLPLATGATLALAGLVTVVALQLLLGQVLGLSLGFSAVLIGLGVDAMIHGAGRWRAAAGAASPTLEAVRTAGPAVVVALLTTAVAFLSLQLASLRLVREVGLLVVVGLAAVLLSTLLVSIPLAVRSDARATGAGRGLAGWATQVPEVLVRCGQRHRTLVLAVASSLALGALLLAPRIDVQGDLSGFRPASHPALETERELLERFRLGADSVQVLVRGDDLDGALERARALAAGLRATEESELAVTTPSDLLAPERVGSRASRLRELDLQRVATNLEGALREAGLAPAAFAPGIEALKRWGEGPVRAPPSAWPDWVHRQVRTGDGGAAEVLVTVRAAGAAAAAALADDIGGEGIAVASSSLVARDVEAASVGDLGRLAGAASAGLFVVLVLAYGLRPRRIAMALLPVGLGSLVTGAGLVLLGQPLDLLGVAMLPILLGIGIDDGIHATLDSGASGSVIDSVRGAAPAMTLTTLTTALGFGSLGLSSIPSLAAAGLMVALGVTLCWLATLLVLPALSGPPAGPSDRRASAPLREVSSQAPEVAGWRRALFGRLHWSGAFWYRLHAFGVRILPEWILPPATRLFALIFVLGLGGVRRGIASNLDAVLGRAQGWVRWQRSYRTLLNHAWCMNESYEGLQGLGERRAPKVEGLEHWRAVADPGLGFVMVTAHVGHWEVGSHLTEAGKVPRVHVIREPEMDPGAQEYLEELTGHASGDDYVVHFTRGEDPTLGAVLLRALRQGEVVALQGDRPSARGRAVEVELFGRSLQIPAGPAALARAAEVPLLPVFVFRDGRQISTLCFRPPIEVSSTRPSRPATAAAMQAYATELEAAIRREPHQWFCLRALWPESGGGSDADSSTARVRA